MLLSFKVSNFKSILEPVCLSMLPDDEDRSLSDKLYKIQGMEISPIAIIMGPNGSGKSTVLDAFMFVRQVALRKLNPDKIQRNKLALDKSSYFEVCMCFERSVIGTVQKYRIEIDPSGEAYESLWVLKDDEWVISCNENHLVHDKNDSNPTLPIQFENVEKFFKSVNSFDALVNSLESNTVGSFMRIDNNGNQKSFQEIFKRVLNEFGVNIKDVDFPDLLTFLKEEAKPIPKEMKGHEQILEKVYVLRSLIYDGYSVRMSEESDGTRRLAKIAFIMIDRIFCNEKGITFIIDELGAGLHDTLSSEIIRQFFKICEICEDCKSQLIATTHNTTLLRDKILRKDQIWLTEMKKNRTTDLFSLAELKGVKATEDFAENYLRGKYGALPPRQEWEKEEGEPDV